MFNIGDTVQLNSGGLVMTVTGVGESGVRVTYSEQESGLLSFGGFGANRGLNDRSFPEACLRLVGEKAAATPKMKDEPTGKFAEFEAAVAALEPGYHSVEVEATRTDEGKLNVTYRAYIPGIWTEKSTRYEACIDELKAYLGKPTDASLDIGEIPASEPAP